MAVGRKNYQFADADGRTTAIAGMLIEAAMLDGVDSLSWLTDV